MTWTSIVPTTPGYYWMWSSDQDPATDSPSPVMVTGDGDVLLGAWPLDLTEHLKSEQIQFEGPVIPPSPPNG